MDEHPLQYSIYQPIQTTNVQVDDNLTVGSPEDEQIISDNEGIDNLRKKNYSLEMINNV